MTAEPPSHFGPYQVVASLGAGGMGEVYRARDPRLKRDVAIKILAHAGADPARQQRFTGEAQAASALNHPNIVTVYDVGIHEGTPYIVSEVVEGSSLRELLARAALPLRDVLDLAVQMAEGLAAAHQAGIVHRDFKPENVMVTRDGRVKILDFGLALVGRDSATAPADVTLTATGILVGTVPYMSPEQARGALVDYRTDQFSLGLTLYEMLTGQRAFSAETTAQTLARILEDEPEPIAKISPRTPAPVRWLIVRCLAKDARQRYDSTADLARELRTLRDRVEEFAPPAESAATPPRRRTRLVLAIGALAAAIAIGLLAGRASGGGDLRLDRYRFTPIATDAGYQASPAWSPDGKTLAYIADADGILQVFTRALASPMRHKVTSARFYCRDPFWSPDGSRLFYISLARESEGLWSISAAGGEPELVMENVSAAAMSPDGKTLALFRVADEGLLTLSLSSPPGAAPVPYTRQPFGTRKGFVQATVHFSPDGSKLGAWVISRADAAHDVHPEFWVLPLGSGTPSIAPPPVADLPGVAAAFSWLPDSHRVLSALSRPRPGTHLWVMDTDGGAPRLLTATSGVENEPTVAPDGTSLAMALQQADYDVYQFSVEHPSPSVVLATSRNEMDPVWSSSATAMAFTTDRSGREEIWLRSQTGDFERPLVTPGDFGTTETYLLSAPAISPDGQRIAYNRVGSEGYGIWISPLAGGPPVRLASGGGYKDLPSWSPDGGWIAYASTETGSETSLVKMRVGARTSSATLLATDVRQNAQVQWSPDGAWIAFSGRGGLSVVSPDGKSTRVLQDESWMAFTWSADSQRLFGIRQSDDFKHLTFTSVDIRSGTEHVLGADVMPLPVAFQPVRGLTRVSATTFLASIARVQSDVWLLEGFDLPSTLRSRLGALLFWRRGNTPAL